jgi:hypothetical protein
MSELFEQEVAMEKRSSWGPLLLVLVLIGSIVGGIGYYVYEMKKGLSQEEASAIINEQLKSRVAKLDFHIGKVESTMNEQAKDPHYKLLAKAGLITVKDLTWNSIQATVTDVGEKQFAEVPGFKKWKNPDGTETYELPLATRKLVKIDSITLNGPSVAKVEFEWAWEPTKFGNMLDANGETVKSFGTWDRQKLIQKYGADFYHAAPAKVTMRMQKGDKGWKMATD